MRRAFQAIDWRLLAVVMAAGAMGEGFMGQLPVITGAAMDDLGLSHAQAGVLISVELLALAIGLASTTPFTGIIYRKRVAYRAFVTVLVGAGVSILINSYDAILVGRFICGLGEGVVIAVGTATVATSREPDRLMAQNFAGGVLVGALMLSILPIVAAHYGLRGVYVGNLLCLMCFAPFLRLVPPAPREGASWRTALQGVTEKTGSGRAAFVPYVLIAGMMCIVIMETASWSFVERKGVSLGMGPAEVGRWLATMFLSMFVGSVFAAILGTRWGRVIPFTVGGVLLVVGLFFALAAKTVPIFVFGLLSWNIAWVFLMPYYIGLLSSLDHEGRWNSMSSTILVFTNVFGPLLGGAILSGVDAQGVADFGRLAVIASTGAMVGTVIVVPIMIVLGRRLALYDARA
ncbi:MAG: MFS transporter [Alphaproteobacteria bacterium]